MRALYSCVSSFTIDRKTLIWSRWYLHSFNFFRIGSAQVLTCGCLRDFRVTAEQFAPQCRPTSPVRHFDISHCRMHIQESSPCFCGAGAATWKSLRRGESPGRTCEMSSWRNSMRMFDSQVPGLELLSRLFVILTPSVCFSGVAVLWNNCGQWKKYLCRTRTQPAHELKYYWLFIRRSTHSDESVLLRTIACKRFLIIFWWCEDGAQKCVWPLGNLLFEFTSSCLYCFWSVFETFIYCFRTVVLSCTRCEPRTRACHLLRLIWNLVSGQVVSAFIQFLQS